MGNIIYLKRDEGISLSEKKKMAQLLKVIIYFSNHSHKKIYKTKLNKLLFYSQFLYYKEYGVKLIDYDFIRDFHGPTINELDTLLNKYKEINAIELENTQFGTVINSKININEYTMYTENEKRILEKVIEKFKDHTSANISDYSHKESLWLNTPHKEVIAIERANELNEF